ncbi:DUF924 family protein [Oceanibium sediminis]|uniref:DUF924 family protein n=1 Tax=Oceanibium sediminis TaxID=2026339 RepID=UPI000DD49489|nr:DUF924 family protein [Oceanibium sediminis]
MTKNDITYEDVLHFWIDDVGPTDWYTASDELDARITKRFLPAWEAVRQAGSAPWTDTPEQMLASAILLDQFSRNMHRGRAEAFLLDPLARDTVRTALARGDDAAIPAPQKQFLFLPFTHAEDMATQDEGLAHLERAMPGSPTLEHLRAHREIIRRFGRFPFRNAALGRDTTAEEQRFMDRGGYGEILRELRAAQDEGAA